MFKPEINLVDELNAINRENTLKKKLEKNISNSLTFMSSFDESRKIERLKLFQKVQVLIKRNEISELKEYLKKSIIPNQNILKEFNEKIPHKKEENLGEKGELENSKDRLIFLNKLVTSQANGYNPIKNFMTKFRSHSKIIQERRNRERDRRLNFLKTKERRKDNSKLLQTATRLNKAKQLREIEKRRRETREKAKAEAKNEKNNIKKKKPVVKSEEILKTITPSKSPLDIRLENISFKDGDINTNKEFIEAGFYELSDYMKAMIFKFSLNFNSSIKDKVIDLIDDDGDLVCHINMRNNKNIILNSNISDKWGKEIKVNRTMEGNHIIKILIKDDYFKILDNNKVISFFLQRKSSKVKYLNINDNIKDFKFKVM